METRNKTKTDKQKTFTTELDDDDDDDDDDIIIIIFKQDKHRERFASGVILRQRRRHILKISKLWSLLLSCTFVFDVWSNILLCCL